MIHLDAILFLQKETTKKKMLENMGRQAGFCVFWCQKQEPNLLLLPEKAQMDQLCSHCGGIILSLFHSALMSLS